MWKKQSVIKTYINSCKSYDYWTDKDYKKILSSYKKRELSKMLYILLTILRGVSYTDADLFSAFDCPFCIFHYSDCTSCRYGEVKGKCFERDSVYSILCDVLDNKPDDDVELFYKELRQAELDWCHQTMHFITEVCKNEATRD